MNGAITRMPLPSADGHVNVEWVNFHAIADTAHTLSRNQCRAGAEKTIENNISPCRAVEQGIGDKCYGFYRRVEGKKIALIALTGESVYPGILPDVGSVALVLA